VSLAALVREEMRLRWAKGERVWAEEFLARHPRLAGDPELMLDLVYAEFVLREQAGESPDPAEYLARFPAHADALRRQLDLHRALHAAGSLAPAPDEPTVHQPGTPRTRDGTVPDTRGEEEERGGVGPVSVPGYEVLGVLGKGGMGVVYKARHRALGRVVALKMVLHAEYAGPEERRRFRAEAEAVARLQHPGVVQVFEVGEHNGLPYLALEYCPGGSLAQELTGTPWQPGPAAVLVEALAQAVQAAHAAGLVHRDLKPANVLLAADGTPKVADFGLAKRLDVEGQTQTGAVLGTPSYMAPEQAAGKKGIGPAADVYSLGAILYELLTGRPPFQAASAVDLARQVAAEEPVPVRRLQPKVPRDLETVCLKCLEKQPRKRYASAAVLAEDLRRFGAGAPVSARPLGKFERGLRWARRHPAVAVAYGLVFLVVVLGGLGGGVTWLWQRSEQARGQLADEKRQSEAARHEAEQARTRLAEASYLRQVGLACREWQEAEVDRAEQLLESCPPQRRGWEWHYVRRLCHADLLTRRGHPDPGLAFGPDGQRLASVSPDHTIQIWDACTGREISLCQGHAGTVASVVFSPDGLSLASASADHTARVWDGRTGRERFPLPHKEPVVRAAFSPNGRFIATAIVHETITLWDAYDGQVVRTFKGPAGQTHGVAFSPDGRRLAGWGIAGKTDISGKGEVKLWDRQTGREVLSIGHTVDIIDVAFSPDGGRLAGASIDKTVRVWDVRTGRLVLTLSGHSDQAAAVTFSPDGTHLASGGSDQTVRVWDAATGQEVVCHKGHKGPVTNVAFSPDGQRLASRSADGTVKVWRATADPRADCLAGHTRMIAEVKVSPDGRTLASSSCDGTIRLWDLATRRPGLSLPAHPSGVECVAFSPDGKRLASGGKDGLIKVWDVSTSKEVLSWTGHAAPVWSVAFSPDGTRLASVGCAYEDKQGRLFPGEARLWDARTGEVLFTLRGDWHGFICLAFSPDGKRLACGSYRDVVMWDVETGQQQLSFRAHADLVVGLAFSPDGRRLASASFDKTVKVWDATSGTPLYTFDGHTARVTCVAFSPDGRRLASGGDDHTIRIVVADTGEEALSLKGAIGPVHSLAFSPDGNLLVSGGWDSLVRVWDARPPDENRQAVATPGGSDR
jgi:WD40 repeat protein/tRNA A-37 threonylcarbamoyl transferase component Bud32